jgi:hypothetical protein
MPQVTGTVVLEVLKYPSSAASKQHHTDPSKTMSRATIDYTVPCVDLSVNNESPHERQAGRSRARALSATKENPMYIPPPLREPLTAKTTYSRPHRPRSQAAICTKKTPPLLRPVS